MPGKKQPYIERLNTPERLQIELLKKNIAAVDLMAANMMHPHEEYPVFRKLMDKLVRDYGGEPDAIPGDTEK